MKVFAAILIEERSGAAINLTGNAINRTGALQLNWKPISVIDKTSDRNLAFSSFMV